MKVTYIGHSGFLVETEDVYLLFDCVASEEPTIHARTNHYQNGHMPELNPEKQLLVFVSHRHGDHYSFNIWRLKERYKDVIYVLDRKISLSAGVRKRQEITDDIYERIYRVLPNEIYEIPTRSGVTIKVETLKSTDIGVAFFVTAGAHTIYHAGDLNWWHWEEEGPEYCEDMRQQFFENTKPIAGRSVEVGFLLLDPRLEQAAYLGMDAYLQMLHCEKAFPMHMWDQYNFTDQYLSERKNETYANVLQKISKPGQMFEF